MSDKKKIISLEEVLMKFNEHNRGVIDEIDKEEAKENLGSINTIEKNIENEIKAIIYSSDLKKLSYINELKNGLGEEVKKNPNKINIIEKPKLSRFKKFMLKIKTLFTKF